MSIKVSVSKISLFLIIFQSIGIRLFSGFGVLLMLIVISLNISNLSKFYLFKNKAGLSLLLAGIVLVCLLKGFPIISILYIIIAIFTSLLVLINYHKDIGKFVMDLKPILWFFAIYGFISWLLVTIIPSVFIKVNHGLNYLTFFYIITNIYVADTPIPRLSSLCWEPGCCQFLLNILLILLIEGKDKFYKIVFIGVLVLATLSTTGYINLIFIAALYLSKHKKNAISIIVLGGVIFSLGLFSLISSNITDKFANSSGIIRIRDFYVGYNLTKNHPVIGVDTENLSNNSEAQILEDEVWGGSALWTDSHGYFDGGFTNGFMGVFLDYGIILGFALFWCTLKSPLIWGNRKNLCPWCFFCIYFCSLTGEPIARTTFFFLLAFSYFLKYSKGTDRDNKFILESVSYK